MKLSDFDYELPPGMIAQEPASSRDRSKLLILDLQNDTIQHVKFSNIIDYFDSGDTIVLNDTRVVNARLHGHKSTGGKVELLLLDPQLEDSRNSANPYIVECLIKGRVRPDVEFTLDYPKQFDHEIKVRVLEQIDGGKYKVEFKTQEPITINELLTKYGELPLPPYIKKSLQDSNRYQTVYSNQDGSIAAPTAGLHFTPELLQKLEDKGVIISFITLHISYGTFTPVRTDNIKNHRMDREYGILSEGTVKKINQARNSKGSKLTAVGTTTVRTLETAAHNCGSIGGSVLEIQPWQGWTELFIYPGFDFKAGIDVMITNFHLPKSTLLMLVSAFAGRENILKAYKEAIEKKYRFYSLGDAMMIIK